MCHWFCTPTDFRYQACFEECAPGGLVIKISYVNLLNDIVIMTSKMQEKGDVQRKKEVKLQASS